MNSGPIVISLSTPEEFAEHAKGRKQLRLEYFYRELRRKHDILMDGSEPEGGKWNYDSENRGSFGKDGPGKIPSAKAFSPRCDTKEVITLVDRKFTKHPGKLDSFDWPVTPKQAQQALSDFIENRLPRFGEYQDAMWTDEPYLYHSRISAALNLKLLSPLEVIEEALVAYRAGHAPLNAVEGFVRQILGWREYVRGIYWLYMPEYLDRNAMNATQPLPDFYWTGETEMHCLQQAIGQTLDYGYAHHIQRLMVTGLFALLLGVDPKAGARVVLGRVRRCRRMGRAAELAWHVSIRRRRRDGQQALRCHWQVHPADEQLLHRLVDLTRPRPQAVTPVRSQRSIGITCLRHQKQLTGNNRMAMQLKNLDRKKPAELKAIHQQAKTIREALSQ